MAIGDKIFLADKPTLDSVKTTIETVNTKVGTNVDASGTGSLFAWFKRVYDYVVTIKAVVDGLATNLTAGRAGKLDNIGIFPVNTTGGAYTNIADALADINSDIHNVYNSIITLQKRIHSGIYGRFTPLSDVVDIPQRSGGIKIRSVRAMCKGTFRIYYEVFTPDTTAPNLIISRNNCNFSSIASDPLSFPNGALFSGEYWMNQFADGATTYTHTMHKGQPIGSFLSFGGQAMTANTWLGTYLQIDVPCEEGDVFHILGVCHPNVAKKVRNIQFCFEYYGTVHPTAYFTVL